MLTSIAAAARTTIPRNIQSIISFLRGCLSDTPKRSDKQYAPRNYFVAMIAISLDMRGDLCQYQSSKRSKQMFILKSTKTDAIVAHDGEIRPSSSFGPLGLQPKLFKTRAGAERAASQRVWRKVVELDRHGCEVK
jgi:hypothetical protein